MLLNIVPDNLKKEIQHRLIYESYKKFLGLVLICVCVYAITVLFALFFIQQYFVETINKTNIITKSTENYTNKVNETNNQISTMTNIQNEFVKWSSLLKILSENISDGISLNQLTLSREKNTIHLSGTAAARDDLLKLKDFLDRLDFFHQINFPISNLLERNNINFEISAQISNYEF